MKNKKVKPPIRRLSREDVKNRTKRLKDQKLTANGEVFTRDATFSRLSPFTIRDERPYPKPLEVWIAFKLFFAKLTA